MALQEKFNLRRSIYALGRQSTLDVSKIQKMIEEILLSTPSAFNSQSTRIVLLLGDDHIKLWDITKDALLRLIGEENFSGTKAKIEGCFQSGHGTILFFEDQNVVKGLQEAFPLYKDSFPTFSEHTSAMHQYAAWTRLAEIGYGATLQHYNPVIDADVANAWNLPESWKLVAQMPFGDILQPAGEKEFNPIEDRFKVFGK